MSGEATAMTLTWQVGKRRVTVTVPKVRTGQVLHAGMRRTQISKLLRP